MGAGKRPWIHLRKRAIDLMQRENAPALTSIRGGKAYFDWSECGTVAARRAAASYR